MKFIYLLFRTSTRTRSQSRNIKNDWSQTEKKEQEEKKKASVNFTAPDPLKAANKSKPFGKQSPADYIENDDDP